MQLIRITEETFDSWRDQISELLNDSVKINFPDYYVDEDYGNNRCNQLKAYLHDGSGIVFGAIVNDKMCGWLWCHEINRVGKRKLHIAEIVVNEKFRHQGVGTQLLNNAEKYAIEQGILEVDLFVTKMNREAVSFYEKSAYVIERYLMNKKLIQ